MDKYRIEVEERFSFFGNVLLGARKPLYFPTLTGIVVNPKNQMDFNATEKFIIDTGASISILGPKFESFLNEHPPDDSQNIRYGNSKVTLPVYKIELKVKGYSFPLKAALDINLKFNSLLGHHSFLDQFGHIILNPRDKVSRLITKHRA